MDNRQRFHGQVVLITGASSGFGLALARAFAAATARVVLTARDPARLEQATTALRQDFPAAELMALPGDVADRQAVDRVVAATLAHWGRIDILINNAGVGLIAPVGDTPLADARAVFETNFFGTLNFIQAVLPAMKRQAAGQVVIMNSLSGLCSIPNRSIYSASKAALLALADALRIELRRTGISVTSICPGRVSDTGFFANARKHGALHLENPPEKFTTAIVVQTTLAAIARRKRTVLFPFQTKLAHLLGRFAPRYLERLLYRRMVAQELTVPEDSRAAKRF